MKSAMLAMRAAGGRITAQRRLVLDALVATQPHPSAEDVTAHVQSVDPDVHQSTVYRTLHALTDLGVVSHVHLDHGRSVYHFTHADAPHLVCRTCSAVTHLDTDTFTKVRQLVSGSTGFDLEHGDVIHATATASSMAGEALGVALAQSRDELIDLAMQRLDVGDGHGQSSASSMLRCSPIATIQIFCGFSKS